jgi:hypothetical protein
MAKLTFPSRPATRTVPNQFGSSYTTSLLDAALSHDDVPARTESSTWAPDANESNVGDRPTPASPTGNKTGWGFRRR